MLNVSQFIADHITGRQKSMFAADIEANRDKLRAEIEGKRVLVIGGAGTIGSSYIRAVLPSVLQSWWLWTSVRTGWRN